MPCIIVSCRFDCRASLLRVAATSPANISIMQKQAHAEHTLLQFYQVELPPHCMIDLWSVCPHSASEMLLTQHNAWLLSRYLPASVGADGNCFFRAVSLSLYGDEHSHILLRLLACIEVLTHPDLYDKHSTGFYQPYKCDPFLQLPEYGEFVHELVKDGAYSDMLTALAVSTVVQKAIQTVWPICIHPGEQSPMTKLIIGRDVATVRHPLLILWTVTTYAAGETPVINHFVPLIERMEPCDPAGVVMADTSSCDDTTQSDVTDSDANFNDSAADSQTPDRDDVQADVTDDGANVSEPAEQQGHASARGGFALRHASFLPLAAIVDILRCSDIHEYALSGVPLGNKDNVFFLVDNSDNLSRAACGQRNAYWDDCGAWGSTRTLTSYHLRSTLAEIRISEKVYCQRKKVDGRVKCVPLSPQPNPEDVMSVHRYYATLARDHTYQKRITWLENGKCAVVEYLGTFTAAEVQPHGSARSATGEYVRTQPAVLDDIRQKLQTKQKPSAVYAAVVKDAPPDSPTVRNLKQVHNTSYTAAANDRAAKRRRVGNNLADDILDLCNRVANADSFVRIVTLASGCAPTVILYTDEQINDLKRLCSSQARDDMRSVLGVDRTFNLSSLFLTLTVYKNKSVTRARTNDAPLFIGPMMLHGDGQYRTYLRFFSELRGALNCDVGSPEVRTQDIITGSDEEKALVRAVRDGLHVASHLFCSLHAKDNLRHHMTHYGVPQDVREKVISLAFGTDGVSTAADSAAFDARVSTLMQYVRQSYSDIADYVSNRAIPKLRNNCELMWANAWLAHYAWNNNNCESVNNLLKIRVDWKPARVSDLVDHLQDLVQLQHRDVRRALSGQGNYQLAPALSRHYVPFSRWTSMTESARDTAFAAFMADNG